MGIKLVNVPASSLPRDGQLIRTKVGVKKKEKKKSLPFDWMANSGPRSGRRLLLIVRIFSMFMHLSLSW